MTQTATGGGFGGKTGMYFIDMNDNAKMTDVARCITTRQDSGIMEALERLKHEPITLDNQALRKLIDCIRVMSKDEIQIIFKSGFVRIVPLKQ